MLVDLGGDARLFIERIDQIGHGLGGAVKDRLQVRGPGRAQIDEALDVLLVRRVLDDQALVLARVQRIEVEQFFAHGNALLRLLGTLDPGGRQLDGSGLQIDLHVGFHGVFESLNAAEHRGAGQAAGRGRSQPGFHGGHLLGHGPGPQALAFEGKRLGRFGLANDEAGNRRLRRGPLLGHHDEIGYPPRRGHQGDGQSPDGGAIGLEQATQAQSVARHPETTLV